MSFLALSDSVLLCRSGYNAEMIGSRELIEFCELPEAMGVESRTGHRQDTRCEGRAVFDRRTVANKKVRYSLSALWDEGLPLLFGVGLNPSKADERKGDITVNRAIRAAQGSGRFGGLFWVNTAAQMETDSSTWISDGRPDGPLNTEQLRRVFERLHRDETKRDILLAWGDRGPRLTRWLSDTQRDPRVRLLTLGMTENGHPWHPQRLKGELCLKPLGSHAG